MRITAKLADFEQTWSNGDPLEFGLRDTLPQPRERSLALQEITTQWSNKNSRSAYKWAANLPDSDTVKFELMPSVIRRPTITDPGLAAD